MGAVEQLAEAQLLPIDILPVDFRAQEREQQHEDEDFKQASSGSRDGLGVFGEEGEASVDEFDVDPIDEQRGLAELEERAESPGREAPAAPGVGEEGDQEQESEAHHEEVRAGMPVIVDGVEVELGVVEAVGDGDGGGSGGGEEGKSLGGVGARGVGKKDESGGESSEGEGGPGEDGEEPGLRGAEVVASIDIGLDIPGKPGGAMRGVEGRGEECDEGGGGESGEDDSE